MNKEEALNNLKNDLRQPGVSSLNDFFKVCNEHFNFDAKLGSITKTTLIQFVSKFIDISGAKPRLK